MYIHIFITYCLCYSYIYIFHTVAALRRERHVMHSYEKTIRTNKHNSNNTYIVLSTNSAKSNVAEYIYPSVLKCVRDRRY